MPTIPGFADCWGISVIHCPYCHGYEYKEQETGILLNGDPAFELARMIRNLTSRLTIFTNGNSLISEMHQAQLIAMRVGIEEREISEFVHKNGYISSIVFKDGTHSSLDALYARPAFEQHCQIPKEIGCKFTDAGHIKVDDVQRTSIPGVFAAGDNATGFRAVAIAIAAGNKAGAVINHELVAEKTW
ncbi:Thioredoxin reductase [compost metagenome]